MKKLTTEQKLQAVERTAGIWAGLPDMVTLTMDKEWFAKLLNVLLQADHAQETLRGEYFTFDHQIEQSLELSSTIDELISDIKENIDNA